MGFSRRGACRVDSNHAEIVSALKDAGVSVLDLSAVGGGCPDILAAIPSWQCLLEIKAPLGPRTDPDTHDDAKDLTAAQVEFLARWKGPRIFIVRSAKDALDLFGRPTPASMARGAE